MSSLIFYVLLTWFQSCCRNAQNTFPETPSILSPIYADFSASHYLTHLLPVHPGVNLASAHGLTPVTVHMSFSLPRGNFERRVTRNTTPGNPPCRGNFSPCEQNAKSYPGARVVLRMLINNVWDKFSNKKFKKASEICKYV